MKRYGLVTGALVLALVTAFAAVEAAGVPVLTEPEPAIMAGTAGTSPLRMAGAAAAGGLPAAVMYALAGSLVVGAVSGAAVFVAVLALAATFWLLPTHRDDAPRLRRM